MIYVQIEDTMPQATLKSLEKRVAAIEQSLEQLLGSRQRAGVWKDWRLAVAKAKRTELAQDVDAAARKIREADRRQVPTLT
jgi:hypothetical protein